ncbi:hypothetical protein [Nocardioides aurantiacus]|uniref:Uncharacterized protein n=1 Tax=Nocardioides aurantiacus TaxID=86796 RepID=A0A3N2CSJ6_9ACTN|nr:hypothetical protein [Nocardioides aurantiacus]ROR90396.1 hypothetical protein EDD33_1236 [Nocardioides aurantiacus]
MRRRGLVVGGLLTLALGMQPGMSPEAPATAAEQAAEPAPTPVWRVLRAESFTKTLTVNSAPWVRDPQTATSRWAVDQFDDNGRVWHAISDPAMTRQLRTMNVYRKRVAFGTDGWLTAEVAAVDKNRNGIPDSQPGLATTVLPDGQRAARISEPSWDAGVVIRPTRALPAAYRVEMTLRGIDFGGKRHGSLQYAGKTNGYRTGTCKTAFPWTFSGAIPGRPRCRYPSVTKENGFYFLTILDHANGAPHGNAGIHYRRKVVLDSYNSQASWSASNAICNPATGKLESTLAGTYNAVNAAFVRGDAFRRENNNVGNQYFFRTPCGDFDGAGRWGPDGRYRDLASSVELRPELLPTKRYRFAVERDASGYTIELTGPFRHVGQATYRLHHDFVEDGRPIWHYNQTPGEYDGRFDRSLTHTGPAGKYVTRHTWPAGSAYPDSFVIGDPHLNFYEGSAVVDDVRLLVPTG